MAEHRASDRSEDAYREITNEADLHTSRAARDDAGLEALDHLNAGSDNERANRRCEPIGVGTGSTLSASEMAALLARAREALCEIERRGVADVAREVDEQRAVQLARWEAVDQVAAAEHDIEFVAARPGAR